MENEGFVVDFIFFLAVNILKIKLRCDKFMADYCKGLLFDLLVLSL